MRCCSPLLENTDVRYCPATFATLTCCSSLIPLGKSCSIGPALCEHLSERLIFQEHPLCCRSAFRPSAARSSPNVPTAAGQFNVRRHGSCYLERPSSRMNRSTSLWRWCLQFFASSPIF